MATSRLKKQVERQQQSTSSTSSTEFGNLLESFVSFGTPLPSLASTSKDANEFVPVWEQQVVDEQGRRRFHGAFTGGFSAGYFNSVGSKEGWTPSTFTSSRSIRASKEGATSTEELAKGLMDEEDLEAMNSSRVLQTSSTYSAPSQAYDPLSGPISMTPTPSAALASLIEPASSRIGLKLMRKMGWREGQGVGPRLTFQQRRDQAKELGVRLDDDEADDEAKKYYYAPLDRPLHELGGVSDKGWGLGYAPNRGVERARGMEMKEVIRSGMDEDDDEDDVYGPSVGTISTEGAQKHKWVEDLNEIDDGFDHRIKGTKGKGREKPIYQVCSFFPFTSNYLTVP